MKERLSALKEQALEELERSSSIDELRDLRVKYLGKKSPISEVLRELGSLDPSERPAVGMAANEVRRALEQAFAERERRLLREETARRLEEERIDVTLPGRAAFSGAVHPLMKVVEEIEDIFIGMGYAVAEGPEVERDYYNFEALNLPKDHPARDMQDSFYVTDETLLRTHTSPVQARTMERMGGRLPIRIICPGKVYRRDTDDATHSHQFMQVEGLVVDRNVRMSDLKGTLLEFARRMFGPRTDIRLRPSYFPFTEPSAEVDVSCVMCGGSGCRVCKQSGWLEILGCGMVHPRVLEMSGYDPASCSGFAFGMGVERIAMLKYGIDDIRHFYQNDVRFLRQFAHW